MINRQFRKATLGIQGGDEGSSSTMSDTFFAVAAVEESRALIKICWRARRGESLIVS